MPDVLTASNEHWDQHNGDHVDWCFCWGTTGHTLFLNCLPQATPCPKFDKTHSYWLFMVSRVEGGPMATRVSVDIYHRCVFSNISPDLHVALQCTTCSVTMHNTMHKCVQDNTDAQYVYASKFWRHITNSLHIIFCVLAHLYSFPWQHLFPGTWN